MKQEGKDIRETLKGIIISYTGTDFREFCSYVNEEIEKLIPEECPEKPRWKAFAFGMMIAFSDIKQWPEDCFTVAGKIFGVNFMEDC